MARRRISTPPPEPEPIVAWVPPTMGASMAEETASDTTQQQDTTKPSIPLPTELEEAQKAREDNPDAPPNPAYPQLYYTTTEKDGVKTISSALTAEDAAAAAKLQSQIPETENLREHLDRVPGVLNLTANGTLQNDRTKKTFSDLNKLNEVLEATAGDNPLPNRVGNELTNIENGFTASGEMAWTVGAMKRLNFVLEKTTDEEVKKKLNEVIASIQ